MKDLKSLFSDTKANNTILMLVAMAIGVLILIVVVTLIPAVSYNVQTSLVIPTTGTAGGTDAALSWNTNKSEFTNGSEMWAQLSPMISTTALVSIVGVLIAVLLGALAMRQRE